MGQKFKPGDPVKQVMPAPITGRVAGYDFDHSEGKVRFKVVWADGEHEACRFFDAEELVADTEQAAKDATAAKGGAQ